MIKKSIFVLFLIILLLPQIYPSSGASCDSECVNFENYYDGAININFDEGTKTLKLHFYGTNLDNGSLGVNVTNAPIILKLTYKDKYDNNNNNKKITTEYKVLTTNQGGDATYDLSSQIQNMEGVLTIRALYCYNYTDKTALDVCGRLFGLSGSELENKLQNAPGYPNTQDPQSYQSPKHVKIAFSDYYYTKPTSGLTAPAFCLPVAIVLALVMAGMQAVGKNPLAMFDISTPHMNNVYAKYNARGVTTMVSSATSVLAAAGKLGAGIYSVAKNGFSKVSLKEGFEASTTAVMGVDPFKAIGAAKNEVGGSGKKGKGKGKKGGKKGGKKKSAVINTIKMIIKQLPIVGGIVTASLNVSTAHGTMSKGLKAYTIIVSVFGALPITKSMVGILSLTAGVALVGTKKGNIADMKKAEANLVELKKQLKGVTETKKLELMKEIKDNNDEIVQAALKLSVLTGGTLGSILYQVAANKGADAVIKLNKDGFVNSDGSINYTKLGNLNEEQKNMLDKSNIYRGVAVNFLDKTKGAKSPEDKEKYKKETKKFLSAANAINNSAVNCYLANMRDPDVGNAMYNVVMDQKFVDKDGKVNIKIKADDVTREYTKLKEHKSAAQTTKKFIKKADGQIKAKNVDPIGKDANAVFDKNPGLKQELNGMGMKAKDVNDIVHSMFKKYKKPTYKQFKDAMRKAIKSKVDKGIKVNLKITYTDIDGNVMSLKDRIRSAMSYPSPKQNPWYRAVHPSLIGETRNLGALGNLR